MQVILESVASTLNFINGQLRSRRTSGKGRNTATGKFLKEPACHY
jgi:hypothetical protein